MQDDVVLTSKQEEDVSQQRDFNHHSPFLPNGKQVYIDFCRESYTVDPVKNIMLHCGQGESCSEILEGRMIFHLHLPINKDFSKQISCDKILTGRIQKIVEETPK